MQTMKMWIHGNNRAANPSFSSASLSERAEFMQAFVQQRLLWLRTSLCSFIKKKKGRDLGVRDRWQEIFHTAPLGMRIEADTSLVVFIQQQTMRGDLKLKNKIVEIRHR